MTRQRLGAVALALSLHAGLAYDLFVVHFNTSMAVTRANGDDRLGVVATVDLEGNDLFTLPAEPGSNEAKAALAEAAQPSEMEAPKDDGKSTLQKPEDVTELTTEEAPKEAMKAVPEGEQTREPTQSFAVKAQDEQTAKATVAAVGSPLWSTWQIKVHLACERAKKKPSRDLSGDVVLSLTIAPSGQLLSYSVMKSSGTPELDRLALATIARAAPFPPIPSGVSHVPVTLAVPFQYRVE